MISSVKAYARSRLTLLGLTEWSDGFNFQNIPRTLLNNVFHVELRQCNGAGNNQGAQHIECPISVRLFMSQGIDPKTLIDDAIVRADAFISDMIMAQNRLTFDTCVKDVKFDALDIEPIDASNDNGIIIKVDFTVLVIIATY